LEEPIVYGGEKCGDKIEETCETQDNLCPTSGRCSVARRVGSEKQSHEGQAILRFYGYKVRHVDASFDDVMS